MSKGIVQDVAGVALLVGSEFIPGGQVFLGVSSKMLVDMMIAAGSGLVLQPIGTMLTSPTAG